MKFDQALQVRENLTSFRQDLMQADDEITRYRREMEDYPVPEDAVDLHAKLIDYLATSSAVLSMMMRAIDLPDDGEEAQYGEIVGEMHRLSSTLALNVAELDQAQDDYARRHRISVRFRGAVDEEPGN
ncbi:MAG: hypothetical protein LBV45_07500 [Xanthomonadaceae bacterium]|nr:hypothetical protein [Xanthomonadaceae bacterium]